MHLYLFLSTYTRICIYIHALESEVLLVNRVNLY